MSNQFTPTPYKRTICGKDIEIGAETSAGHLSVAWILNWEGDNAALSDADFIVHACNSHDDLYRQATKLKEANERLLKENSAFLETLRELHAELARAKEQSLGNFMEAQRLTLELADARAELGHALASEKQMSGMLKDQITRANRFEAENKQLEKCGLEVAGENERLRSELAALKEWQQQHIGTVTSLSGDLERARDDKEETEELLDKTQKEIAALKFIGNSDSNEALRREYEKEQLELSRVKNAAYKYLQMKASCVVEIMKEVARNILVGRGPNA